MASIGTVTIDVETKFDLTGLRAFADTYRELADKADALILALEAAEEKPTPAEPKRPRFLPAQINGVWGILDSENPTVWAAFEGDARQDVVDIAKKLNADPSERDDWMWTFRGTP